MKLDKQRVLLIHPLGYNASGAEHDIARIANIMPPLGLCSIAAYVEDKGFSADIIDCFAHPDSDGVIKDSIKLNKPKFIGVTCTTNGFLDAIRLVKMCKELSPESKTIVGGPHISALKEKILKDYPILDFAVIGEGEVPLEQLLQGMEFCQIKGLVYREEQKIIFNGYQDAGVILDELPLPAYEKLAGFPHAYQLPIFNYPTYPSASCITSRGCPYTCSYCDRSVFRRSFRYNSAVYVYKHMNYMKTRWGITHLNFYDDQFSLNRERIVNLCQMLIDNPLSMTFNCAIRAEHVDYDLLVLMRKAGCWMISLGIETGDPELLAQHRQNADLDMVASTIRDIHKAGVRVKGLLMLGLPGESEESVKRSMKYVFSLPIDDFNLAKFTPFPGSPLYEKIHEYGEFEEDYAKMDCMNFVFVTHGMTKDRLEKLFLKFYSSHFKRNRVIWGYITMLWKSPHSWKRFVRNIFSFLKFAKSNKRMNNSEKG